MASRLPLLAPLGAVLFTVSWFVLGFISPGYRLYDIVVEPYSPLAQPISGLGLGVTGPYMNAAFVASGLLIIAGAIGIARQWPAQARVATAVLLGLSGVGLVTCGLFTFEAVMLHLTGFLLATAMPAVGFIVGGVALRRVMPRLSTWLLVAGPVALVLLVVFQLIFDPYRAGDNAGIAGLEQRVLATLVVGTIGAIGLAIYQHSDKTQAR